MPEKSQKEISLLIWLVIVVAVIWTIVNGGSVLWSIVHGKEDAESLARQAAIAYFNKDKAFRFWATSHGGVYVPVDERTPPNPNLSHIQERDLVTPSGRQLTLMNPAYMVRQLMNQYSELYGIKGKITSLKLLNPINMPDAWERQAMQAFEHGKEEVLEISAIDGHEYLRLIRPLVTKVGCLKCHAHQGYKVGDIRGGVGVAVPLSPYMTVYRDHIRVVVLFHILVWSMGLIVLFFLYNRGRKVIGDRAQVEEERQKLQQQMALILESLHDGVIGLDKKGRATFANPAATTMCEYSREEILGTCIHEKIHHRKKDGSPYPLAECPHQQTIARGKAFTSVEEVFWKKGGGSFPVEYTSTPLGKDGETEGAVLTFRDLTLELDKLELSRQLRQAQKMEAIGTLAGGIAHDFNNILTIILGYADMALDAQRAGEKVETDIKQVIQAGNRAKELVKQILTFSRQTEHELQPLQLQPVLKEGLKLLRASIPTTIEIRQNIDTKCREVLADPTQIHQVLINLSTNAYHAMREGGGTLGVILDQVEIGKDDFDSKMALPPGPYARIVVSDSGVGMDSQTRQKIFEPYFTTKAKGEGTGLGLSIVHGIIKSFKGEITVYSEKNRGTTFHIYLPIVAFEPDQGPVAVSQDSPRGHGERVLVVDDEQEIVKLLDYMLHTLGYQVTGFTDSQEALEAFSREPEAFDLVVTDMTMPHMIGTELAQRLLSIRPELPIILCTGFSEAMNRDNILGAGIKELIMKPVIKNELGQKVCKVLAGR